MENNPVLFEDEYVTQQLLSASIVEAAQVCTPCLSQMRQYDAAPPPVISAVSNEKKAFRSNRRETRR